MALATAKIGGGGQVISIDFSLDAGGTTSTKAISTDSSGGYWFNPALPGGNAGRVGAWQRIDNFSSMPSADLSLSYGCFRGALNVRIAPSNPNRWYMCYSMDGVNATMYFSTNKGASWTKATTFSNFTGTPNDTPQKFTGPILAVDPNNELVAIVGSRSAGAQKTTNGGVTWSAVSGITNANGNGIVIAYHPTTANSVYLYSAGTGIYHSTDGGTTWVGGAPIASSPTSVNRMLVDQNGLLWVVAGSPGGGTLQSYNGSAWTSFSQLAGQANVVAVSPGNANVVVLLSQGSGGNISFDGGATWTSTFSGGGSSPGQVNRIATDIPWLANTLENFMTNSELKFDPAETQWTTSGSSNSIASVGTATWTTVSTMGLAFGTVVTAYQTSNPNNRVQGTVTSNIGTNLQIALTASNGSGAGITDWTVGTMKLYVTEGIGLWTTNLPISFSTQALTWTSVTAGIENLVPRWMISPWGATSKPIFTSEDRPVFVFSDPTTYPSHQFIGDNQSPSAFGPICHGWCADWAGQSPLNVVALIGGSGKSGWSTDGGVTWNTYGVTGSTTMPLGFTGNAAGNIAMAASSVNHIIWQQHQQQGGFRTTDGGVTWNVMVYPNNIPSAGGLAASANGNSPITFSSIPAWLSSSIANGATYHYFTNSNNSGTITGIVGSTLTVTYSGQVTSISSNNIAGGTNKTWTTSSSMGLGAGALVQAWQTSNSANYVYGTVVSDVTTTLVMAPVASGGSGTGITDWTIAPGVNVVNAGDTIFLQNNADGWGGAGFTNIQALAADRVTDDVFYQLNDGSVGGTSGGIYKSVDAGLNWTQACSTVSSPGSCPGSTGTPQVRAVPGHAGHIFCTPGVSFGSHPGVIPFWHSTNGGTSWSQPNSNVTEVWAFGYGKADPAGGGYPTIYMYGWVTSIDATYAGIYRSTDEGLTWTRLTPAGISGQYPNGMIDSVITVEGDANIYGTFYVGFGGSGWIIGSLDPVTGGTSFGLASSEW